MANKETNPENNNENVGQGEKSILENVGEFDREAAEKAVEDYKKTHAESEQPEQGQEEIDFSCFDQLNSPDFTNLPEEQQTEIINQCEAAYDAAVVDFTHYGDFKDPDTGRYNGSEPKDGLEGAKRGVNYIVQCPIKVERLEERIAQLEEKLKPYDEQLAQYEGFHLFHRKQIEAEKRKIEGIRRNIASEISSLRFDAEQTRKWPEYVGYRIFMDKKEFERIEKEQGSMIEFDYKKDERQKPIREAALAKWYSDEVQGKYQHMVQMRRDIGKAKKSLNK